MRAGRRRPGTACDHPIADSTPGPSDGRRPRLPDPGVSFGAPTEPLEPEPAHVLNVPLEFPMVLLDLVPAALIALWQGPPALPPPLPPAPAGDAAPPLMADLAEIERALAADEAAAPDRHDHGPPHRPTAAAATSQNPDISFIADIAAAWFSEDETRQTGGHDPQKTGFSLQQLEMSLGKAVDPYFRLDGYVVFSQFGVEVEEIFATTLALPANLQLRAGQFLTRFGRLNPTHPHAWDFVDQPIALGRVFGGEGNRGLGLELSALVPLPWYLELVWSATDATGEGTARSFYGGQDLGLASPLDLQHTLAAKQFFPLTEDWSLLSGLSAAFGPNPTGRRNRTDLYGADLYLKWRPVTYASHTQVALQSEWFYRRRQVPGDVHEDVTGYAYLAWRFARRWGTAARHEYGTPTYDRDGDRVATDLDPGWVGHRHRSSVAVTFWPSEFSRLRLQGAADLVTWDADPVWSVFLAFEFLVGAHGAHPF